MEELGYDKSISYSYEGDDHCCLVYQLDNLFFKTTRNISEHLRVYATVPATRVFEVIQVKARNDLSPVDGAKKILKHRWLDAQEKTEKQVLDDILERLSDKKNWKNLDFLQKRNDIEQLLTDGIFRKFFLTVFCDHTLSSSKPLPRSLPRDLCTPAVEMPTPANMTSPSHNVLPSSPGDLSNVFAPSPALEHRDYPPRQSYVVVYNEVCQALSDVPDLRTAAWAMGQCFTGKY